MHRSKTAARRERLRRHFEKHWTRMLYYQLGAYGVVLLFWLLPIPNPIKLLAVTFHELSHGMAALLTGGRVFGIAIAPAGAGVTIGIGGNMLAILLAGYIGSSIWGAALYYVSARCRPRHALLALVAFVFASSFLGWLNRYTMFFGLGTLAVMYLLFWLPEDLQRFFVMMVGSACCLYAPLEVVADAVSAGPPSVMGVTTGSDLSQLVTRLDIPPITVGAFVLAAQSVVLVLLVRWSCTWGAGSAIQEEIEEQKLHAQLRHDLHPEQRRITLR